MQNLRFPVNFVGITTYYSSSHQAIDLGWHDKKDEPIFACADGKVSKIWEDTQFGGGLTVTIQYDNGFSSDFKHLSKSLVSKGQRVLQGEQVAIMGSSGWASSGTHLHYNCYKNGVRVNPLDYTYLYEDQQVSNSSKDKILYYKDDFDLLEEVKKTIRGDYGNGEDRVKNLGSHYEEIQKQVNLNYQHNTIRWDNIKIY